ncbi:MAG: ABC transporter permease [Candidatus Latescibacterota bacterium]
MTLLEPIRMGLGQIRANKLRSLLSLTGILIAVGAVIGVLSLGDGLRNAIVGEFDKIGGASTIFSSGPSNWYRDSKGQWVRRKWEEYLTQRDVDALMAASDKVEYIIPHISVGGADWNITHRAVSVAGQIICTVPLYIFGENWELAKGRFLSYLDLLNSNKVCVLGYQKALDLFGPGVDPVGREVEIGKVRYTVIGVMKEKEFFDSNYNDLAVIPITTAQRRIIGNDRLHWIRVKVKNVEDVDEVALTMRHVYRSIHEHGDDFEIRTGATILEEINKVILILKIIAGSVAGISLLVGGIGIMNIMLVSVTERTSEIGVRKALGAKRSDILWQFLIEALVLCLLGGLLGIALGLGIGSGLAAFIESKTNWVFVGIVSIKMMVFAVGFSLGVGLIFGVYPAWSASRLSPADALRKE